MVQCELGGQRKPSSPDVVLLSTEVFGQFVSLVLPAFPDLFDIWVDRGVLDADTFCSVEPEVLPAPAPEVWISALSGNAADSAEVGNYVESLFKSWVWPQYCECVPPVDYTEYCTLKGPVALNYPANGTNGTSALGNNSVYVNANVFADGASGGSVKFPVGQHKTRFTITANFNGTIEGYYTGVSETYIGSFSSGVTTQIEHSWPTGMAELAIVWRNNTATGGGGMDLQIEFMNASGEAACSSYTPIDEYDPIAPDVPPEVPERPTVSLCDSFEDVCAQINLIRLQLNALARLIRVGPSAGPAPASWWPGVASTGLTGHGTLAVSGIVGAIVECAPPSWWGHTNETPPRMIPSMGSIQFGVAGMETDGQFVHYEQLLALGAPGLTDHIVWNFKPGVTGSITPLYRATVGVP